MRARPRPRGGEGASGGRELGCVWWECARLLRRPGVHHLHDLLEHIQVEWYGEI